MRVMIAEDSGMLRQLLAETLERHGHQVTGQASDCGAAAADDRGGAA